MDSSLPKLLIVFDLDETLLFTRLLRPSLQFNDQEDFLINVEDVVYQVYLRPGATELIEKCQQDYMVGIWSSACADYVNILVNLLFDREKLSFIRHREDCEFPPGKTRFEADPIKDLRRLDHPIERILVIDDNAATAKNNLGNLIRVSMFRDNRQGNDLFQVSDEITQRAMLPDVRKNYLTNCLTG